MKSSTPRIMKLLDLLIDKTVEIDIAKGVIRSTSIIVVLSIRKLQLQNYFLFWQRVFVFY
jgi:hypothetical protein